jgi:8-oxo-dGTP diphosphatase
MPFDYLACPTCKSPVKFYRNPVPTVDIIIELNGTIILIGRKFEPLGWALPGGFIDYGESAEQAAIREAREETGMEITDLVLLGCYSDPARDSRLHTISMVFVAKGSGAPQAGDDAANLELFPLTALPQQLCFDHRQILDDYIRFKANRDT